MTGIPTNRNIRVICVSRPLKAYAAIEFAWHFKDLFGPLFVLAETYGSKREEGSSYHYYVVRVPFHNESKIVGREMNVDIRGIFRIIQASKHSRIWQSQNTPMKILSDDLGLI